MAIVLACFQLGLDLSERKKEKNKEGRILAGIPMGCPSGKKGRKGKGRGGKH